jgi:hypothetical protein
MNDLFGGAFAPPIILPLLTIGYALAYLLALKASNTRSESPILLSGLTLLGWLFITVVIYGLSYIHQSQQRIVFVHLIPWYSLWFVYSGSITLGAAHATARRVARAALAAIASVQVIPPVTQAELPPHMQRHLEDTTAEHLHEHLTTDQRESDGLHPDDLPTA